MVSIGSVALVTTDAAGRTTWRHSDTGVTDRTVYILRRSEAVVIGTSISIPLGSIVTALAACDLRQADVTSCTITSLGRSDDVVVLVTRAASSPEAGIVASETIVLRIDRSVTCRTITCNCLSRSVVVAAGISRPAGGIVTSCTCGNHRQIGVTGLTSQTWIEHQLIVVSLTRCGGVTAFTLSSLITTDDTVTIATVDIGTGADHIMMLTDSTTSGPEGSVVTGLTAIFSHQ